MNKKIKNIAKVMLILGAFSVTTNYSFADTTPITSNGSFVENQSAEDQINSMLQKAYPQSNFTTIVLGNHAFLIGQVATHDQKKEAKLKVKALNNFKVHNYLVVSPPVSAVQRTQDTGITTAAKSRLFLQKDVNSTIKVITENGVVYLIGNDVGNKVEFRDAVRAIRKITGVKKVVRIIKK